MGRTDGHHKPKPKPDGVSLQRFGSSHVMSNTGEFMIRRELYIRDTNFQPRLFCPFLFASEYIAGNIGKM